MQGLAFPCCCLAPRQPLSQPHCALCGQDCCAEPEQGLNSLLACTWGACSPIHSRAQPEIQGCFLCTQTGGLSPACLPVSRVGHSSPAGSRVVPSRTVPPTDLAPCSVQALSDTQTRLEPSSWWTSCGSMRPSTETSSRHASCFWITPTTQARNSTTERVHGPPAIDALAARAWGEPAPTKAPFCPFLSKHRGWGAVNSGGL